MYRRPRKVVFQFAKAFGYYICICLVSGVAPNTALVAARLAPTRRSHPRAEQVRLQGRLVAMHVLC